MHTAALLAALSWDPQIRGALIVLIAFATLCGSVYMLLATSLGARLGFLVAIACLSGWIAMLGLIWAAYGIGDKGRENTWKPLSIAQGVLGDTARPPLDVFPRTWTKLPASSPERAEAQASVDEVLTQGQDGGTPLFDKTSDYIALEGYDKGGEHHGIHLFNKGVTFKHDPHYLVMQLQPTVQVEAVPGQKPPTPKADPSKPMVTVLMVRDLGSLRLPSFAIFLFFGTLFGVTLFVLHKHDKASMIARGILPAPVG